MINEKNQYRWLALSGLLILLSVIFIIIPAKRPVQVPVSTAEKTAFAPTVSRIIDGDTFELSDGTRVRLIGVDTPETNQPFCDQAIAFSESLLLGKTIEYETDSVERDKYGRYLWYVFADTAFVNEKIVGKGLGLVYLFESNLRYAARLIESQKIAREAGLGIWSLPAPPPEEYYIVVKGSYRFHRPLCMSVKGANPEKIVKYYSRNDLLDMGISPCRNCRP